MSETRTFPTTAAVRYDRALNKGLKLNPPPPHLVVPRFSGCWPAENVTFLEKYRDWLVGIGAAEAVINQHRLPMAGHVLGLNLKPHTELDISVEPALSGATQLSSPKGSRHGFGADLDKAIGFIEARPTSKSWQRNCRHSLTWFRRFVQVQRGFVIGDQPSFGDVSRLQEGLPNWLIQQLMKYLHLRQANWRPSRLAQMTTQFWHKSTRIWRWLFEQTEVKIQEPKDITRDHLFAYIDEQLVAGYKVATINPHLHTFQGTLHFLQEQGMAVPQAVLTLPGLKKPHALPRFLTETQVVALKTDLDQQVAQARTTVAVRNAYLDRAMFYLLWQSGMRVSELEDLQQADVDLEAGVILIRAAKGVKDRSVYLTQRVTEAIEQYLTVRGPALTDHLFIYRHKPLSKDLVRNRIKAAGQRTGVKVTPHMLRHTFATQLVNAGAKITTIQALLGHVRLNTTMTYARVHDKTVVSDFLQAMEVIEGEQIACPEPAEVAILEPKPTTEKAITLLNKLENDGLSDEQQQILAELRRCLAEPAPTNQN